MRFASVASPHHVIAACDEEAIVGLAQALCMELARNRDSHARIGGPSPR